MEWIVACGRSLAAAKRVRISNTAYLALSPDAENNREVFNPLLFRLLRSAYRSRVMCVTIVLVQALFDTGQIPLFKSLVPLAHELDLWRIGVC